MQKTWTDGHLYIQVQDEHINHIDSRSIYTLYALVHPKATYYDNYGVMAILLEGGANVFALDCDLNYPINHVIDNSPLVSTLVKVRLMTHQ